MFKLLSDTFVVNEIIGSGSTEALLENEVYISDDMPSIEKIVSTDGKIKINSTNVSANKVTVYGQLDYSIIYRSNDEDVSVYQTSGKIDFMEEIPVQGASEKNDAGVSVYIDYIETEPISERKFTIKAVANIDALVTNQRDVEFISSFESDGSFQAKTKNISYTDIVSHNTDNLTVSDTVELSQNAGEIDSVLKADLDAYITSVDIMNERMLVEGVCKVGFLYTEDNNLSTIGYAAEEFPFTHYVEVKNSNEDMQRDIKVIPKNLTYDVAENYDKEDKLINFTADFVIDSKLYDTVDKNIMVDGYSTESAVEITSSEVALESTKYIKNPVTKYENTLDVMSGTVKDIYTVDISPKISEKRKLDDKYIIDGFLDVNMLYLNGDINKIDLAYSSLPFTISVDLSEEESRYDIDSDLSINRCSAHRKGSSSATINCDITTSLKFTDKAKIPVISNIEETGPLNHSSMPSLVFRVVQPGETLWDIAKNYNVSINYINQLNELSADTMLEPGKKIIISRKA